MSIISSVGITLADPEPVLHHVCLPRPSEIGRRPNPEDASPGRAVSLHGGLHHAPAITARRATSTDRRQSLPPGGVQDEQPEVQHV